MHNDTKRRNFSERVSLNNLKMLRQKNAVFVSQERKEKKDIKRRWERLEAIQSVFYCRAA